MGKFNKLVFALTIFLSLTCCIGAGYKEDGFSITDNVYMIVMNKLTLWDIERMPNLLEVINEGSFGLMNTRGISGYNGAESFVAINTSNKAYANSQSSRFHHLTGEYKDEYEHTIGILDTDYQIGNISMNQLYKQNESNGYLPSIGMLGDLLHQKGLKTAVFGNSDVNDSLIRYACLIPMDSRGLVDYGNLESMLVADIDFCYRMRTDYCKLISEINNIKTKASLIVIDSGDLYRLSHYGNSLTNDMFMKKRTVVLDYLDGFIEDLLNIIDKENSLLIIISPNNGEQRTGGGGLSPIILWGKNIPKSVPISATTNTKGIVTNLDITPTIVDYFDIMAENFLGNKIDYMEKGNSFKFIELINNRINLTSKVRTKTLLIYGAMIITVISIMTILFLMKIDLNNTIGKSVRYILLLIYGLPLIFIVISVFSIDNLLKYIIVLISLSSLLILFYKKFINSEIIFKITYLYIAVISLDVLTKGFISRYSIMSHDPIIGARYFGIGNEMAGILLAITGLVIGLLYEKFNSKTVMITLLFVSVIIVGHPKLGANVGGMIAFITTACYFMLSMAKRRVTFNSTLFTIITMGLLIGILSYIDVIYNPRPTHLARTAMLIKHNGISIVRGIIDRKLLMNIKLVGISVWTKVIIANIFTQLTILILFENQIQTMLSNGLGKGILSIIAGSIVGFIMNDSGLIFAGTAISLITIFIIYFIIDYNRTSIY